MYCGKSVQCVCCSVLVMVGVTLSLEVAPVILCGWRTPLDTFLMMRATVVRNQCDMCSDKIQRCFINDKEAKKTEQQFDIKI